MEHNLCPICQRKWVDNFSNSKFKTKDDINVCSDYCKNFYNNWRENSSKIENIQNHLSETLTIGRVYKVLNVKKDKHGELMFAIKDNYDFVSNYTHFWFKFV